MNEVSKLSGASPVSPTSSRVWKPPRKQKPGNRPAGKRPEPSRKEEKEGRGTADGRENKEPVVIERIGTPDDGDEPLGYGAGVFRKPRNHKVDLII